MDSLHNTNITENPAAIVRISIASDGTQANGLSANPSLSADGRYVAFWSDASNLVPGDTNNAGDIFLRDLQTGETTRVSVASDGTEANTSRYSSYSSQPSLSADGRYVAFASSASNLVPGDTNNHSDLFLHDLQTGQTTRVSTASDGTSPIFSVDGRYVAFTSYANNFVAGDTPITKEILVRDLQTGQTNRLEMVSDFTPLPVYNGFSVNQNGRYLAFSSDNYLLVPGDTNGFTDIFVRDLNIPLPENIIEPLVGTEDHDDLMGTNDPEVFMGGLGSDRILSGMGNDRVYGNQGDDFLDGGQGEDILSGGQDRDILFGREDSDSLSGDLGNDLIYGDENNDRLSGGDGEDILHGGENNDRLNGDSGNDFLYGEQGEDTLYGGEGNDTVDGGEDHDTLYASSGNDIVIGNAGNDRIYGDKNHEFYLDLNSEHDILYGNKGRDFITGGDAQDTLYGGQDNDYLVGDDPMSDDYNSRNSSDLLCGDLGNDVLVGADGNSSSENEIDTLTGGEGNDTLVLVGNSAYYVDYGDADYALITDLNPNQDTIILQENETYQLAEMSTPVEGNSTRIDTYIYQNIVDDERDRDLVAIVQGVSGLSLDSPTFTFYRISSTLLP